MWELVRLTHLNIGEIVHFVQNGQHVPALILEFAIPEPLHGEVWLELHLKDAGISQVKQIVGYSSQHENNTWHFRFEE